MSRSKTRKGRKHKTIFLRLLVYTRKPLTVCLEGKDGVEFHILTHTQ